MGSIEQLLRLTYKRELELERLIERTQSPNKWFFELTRDTNIALQVACLEKMDRIRKLEQFESALKQ